MTRLRYWLWCGVAATLLGGCNAASDAQLSDLRRRLDEQQKRTAMAERKLDDLENRVFLLSDRVESQKVAALRHGRPRLPVVTLQPTTAPVPSDSAATPPSAVPSDEVVFEGDASSADPDHARPTLRVDGKRARTHRLHEKKLASGENLGVAPAPPIAAAADATPAPPGEPLRLYRGAYAALRAGRHEEAERGFREFVRRFPHHDYADNAQYWLGECFYDQKRFDTAAAEFRGVVQRWPEGNKAPDALLKLGYSLLALGDEEKGRATLQELPTAYPRTDAARLAVERLAQLPRTEARK